LFSLQSIYTNFSTEPHEMGDDIRVPMTFSNVYAAQGTQIRSGGRESPGIVTVSRSRLSPTSDIL
jgi:hypothetical protein